MSTVAMHPPRVDFADQPANTSRLVSIDVVRGYAMFLLVAGPPLLQGLRALPGNPFSRTVEQQLSHAAWHGATYLDVGFAAFVTAMGLSTAVSVAKRQARGDSFSQIARHLFVRSALLFALGLLYNGGLSQPWSQIRIAGVLQRIAICNLAAGFACLLTGTVGQILLTAACWIGYAGLLAWVPVPGHEAGLLLRETNLTAYVDQRWLPGQPLFAELGWDSEGLLSTIPAIGTALSGVLLGRLLISRRWSQQDKTLAFLGIGAIAIVAALAWEPWLPFNKQLWTSSYAMFCLGLFGVHFSLFYYVGDVLHKQWFYPLAIVGFNPLLAYLLPVVLNADEFSRRIIGVDLAYALGPWTEMARAAVQIAIFLAVMNFLYRRRMSLHA